MKKALTTITACLVLLISAGCQTQPQSPESPKSWQAVGAAGFSAKEADSTSLAFNGAVPYVAYRDYANGNKATVMKFE